MTNATFTGVKSRGIIGTPNLPSNYQVINGYIVGANVNLTDADLTGADLTGADLTGADLTGAKYSSQTMGLSEEQLSVMNVAWATQDKVVTTYEDSPVTFSVNIMFP